MGRTRSIVQLHVARSDNYFPPHIVTKYHHNRHAQHVKSNILCYDITFHVAVPVTCNRIASVSRLEFANGLREQYENG